MKKLICIFIIAVMLIASLVGCCNSVNAANENNRFEKISYSDHMGGYRINFYRDIKTDIVYMFTKDMDSVGISPLYNADGEPMTYDEFMEEVEE